MPDRPTIIVPIVELGPHVLGGPPDQASPATACTAVRRYLQVRRPELAEVVEVEPGAGAVVLRASCETAEQTLHRVRELLQPRGAPEADGEIEVDAAEFAIEVVDLPEEDLPERELLRSRVRYFPLPECQWFEVAEGDLILTDRRIVFEPELTIVADEEGGREGQHIIPLDEVRGVRRGEWWDVPCLIVETERLDWRYGWPARRSEPELEFDVDEWLTQLRLLLEEGP